MSIFCVAGDIAQVVSTRLTKGNVTVIKLVTFVLAVLLMRAANRRHLWKEASMGVF